jgi:hypothetical protein
MQRGVSRQQGLGIHICAMIYQEQYNGLLLRHCSQQKWRIAKGNLAIYICGLPEPATGQQGFELFYIAIDRCFV